MRAVILAAGLGNRLGLDKPKSLLDFGGKTLLHRHIEILTHVGVSEISIGVGYLAAQIERAVAAFAGRNFRANVDLVHNPDYARGSIVTLWSLRERLCAGGDVLLMDADVLCDQRMLRRLIGATHRNCFLLDREFEQGDEPVKLCVRDGRLIDFRKRVEVACDYCGESVGFFRLSEGAANSLADAAARYIESNRLDEPYEEALRDLLLAGGSHFGFEDITGLPWIEIDFPADVERARADILPILIGLNRAESCGR
jgi:choline kinase